MEHTSIDTRLPFPCDYSHLQTCLEYSSHVLMARNARVNSWILHYFLLLPSLSFFFVSLLLLRNWQRHSIVETVVFIVYPFFVVYWGVRLLSSFPVQSWSCLNVLCPRFNVIQFSGSCRKWRENIQAPSEENCHDAVRWTSNFVANGNTCTLEALQVRQIKTHKRLKMNAF